MSPDWVELQGSVNARDIGGLPTGDGRAVRPGVLIRSANLQHLTEGDVRHLVGERGVRRVVDLRTDVEVDGTGPGPLHDVPDVTIHHLSLYPDLLDQAESVSEAVVALPWHGEFATARGPVVSAYLRYLERRPDSLVAALRAIAEPDGATVVHCAAGKDRTGVVVALALSVAGVPRDVIAADYAVTESQIAAIVSHLARSDMYNREVSQPEKIPPASADIMISVLDAVDEEHGSVEGWLAAHGWTDADTARLRARLVG
jgi:protein-tyrosine phosphatase